VVSEWTDDTWTALHEQEKWDYEQRVLRQARVIACMEMKPALESLLKRLGLPHSVVDGGHLLKIGGWMGPDEIRELLAKHEGDTFKGGPEA